MELTADKPRMRRDLDDLDQVTIHRPPGNTQAGSFEFHRVSVVEFEAVAMALVDQIRAISACDKTAGSELARLATEPHGTADIAFGRALFDHAFRGFPFGYERDHRMLRALIEFG